MTPTTKGIDSAGIEAEPAPEQPSTIGGRADTWRLPHPRTDDDFEPTIIRGRE